MSFRSRNRRRGAAIALGVLFGLATTVALRAQEQNDMRARSVAPVAVTTLFPGGGAMPSLDPIARKYAGNAQAIAAGSRLFDWYNCAGCHFHGAGGIGPSLADDVWIYGGRIDQIYDTIARGRPNGMPSWQGKIPPNEIWEIAAYIRSLSANEPTKDGPSDSDPEMSPQSTPQTVTGLDK